MEYTHGNANMGERGAEMRGDAPAEVKNLPSNTNVGQIERIASGIAGAALAVLGLKKRGVAGLALAALGGSLIYRGATGYCSMYNALGISTSTPKQGEEPVWERGIKVEKSILIDREPAELYRFWRKLDNLPRFMSHLKSVRPIGDTMSHWIVEGPAGKDVEWGAEIINDKENELIAWKSLPEADVDSAGTVRFDRAPDGHGTEVKISLQYLPPAGKLGAAVAKLFGKAPEQEIDADLARFKEMMEAGELAGVEGRASSGIH